MQISVKNKNQVHDSIIRLLINHHHIVNDLLMLTFNITFAVNKLSVKHLADFKFENDTIVIK